MGVMDVMGLDKAIDAFKNADEFIKNKGRDWYFCKAKKK